jgi:hypothetical protein
MKAYGGVHVQIHVFSTSTLVGEDWSASCPGRFIPGTHWIGGWVGPKAGLDEVERKKILPLPVLEPLPFRCPARSQSLYQLPYPNAFPKTGRKSNSLDPLPSNSRVNRRQYNSRY